MTNLHRIQVSDNLGFVHTKKITVALVWRAVTKVLSQYLHKTECINKLGMQMIYQFPLALLSIKLLKIIPKLLKEPLCKVLFLIC